jgi:mRNA interferase MazF
VLTSQEFNQRTGLAIVCPMTSKIKGTLFEVKASGKGDGAVLVHQIRTIDWAGRGAKYKTKISPGVLNEVLARLTTILGLPVSL